MCKLQKSAFIAGLARNCASTLSQTLVVLDRFASVFDRVDYCIITNDSNDQTADILSDWGAGRNNVNICRLDGLAANIKERTARIAVCRNICLAELRRTIECGKKIDYFIVFDMDGVNDNLIAPQEFSRVLQSAPNDWVALFANQRQVYYDIWALRERDWCPTDCWAEVKNATNKHIFKNSSRGRAKKKFITSRQRHIRPETSPIKVQSAFGGLGLYKVEAIQDAFYVGLTERGSQICEHVAFNEQVSKSGRLYIMPSLLNDAPLEHIGATYETISRASY